MGYLYSMLLSLLIMWTNLSFASVVMDGTRVIFDASKNEHELIFTNNDARPYAVQIWLDKSQYTEPENASAPFVVMPHIFQILPKSKQAARLMFVGENLPQDRESLFFLSFRQVPAFTKQEQQQQDQSNNLFLIFRNTVKVFYRPRSIANAKELAGNLPKILNLTAIKLNNLIISLTNTTGYYISLIDAELSTNNEKYELTEGINIAPFSTITMSLPNKTKISANAKLILTAVNDYGNHVTVTKDVP